MFDFLRRQESPPALPPGFRVYAVGDVHGRLDLLDALLEKLAADSARRGKARNVLVMLGDLIDRGPQSAEVVERLRLWRRDGWRTVFLMGNHEEVLLRVLDGDTDLMRRWFQFGGLDCLESYGQPASAVTEIDDAAALALVRRTIPQEHVDFIRSFGDTLSVGDYLFVHAGIRPGIPLDRQAKSDLRWIREPFLSCSDPHDSMVVHGHTIHGEATELPNRIALDTGAYRSGLLTAMGFERDERWLIQSFGEDRAGRETKGEPDRFIAQDGR